MFVVVWCLMCRCFVVCCLVFVVWRLVFGVFGVWCFVVVGGLLLVVCCLLFVAS